MSTEAPDAPLVAPTDKTILWMSRRSDLRLTKRARRTVRNLNTGELEGVTPGQYVGFRDGQIRIPKEGTVTIQDTLDGGEFEIPAEEMNAWLERHRLNGDRQEGFWRVDPTAPPVSQAEMQTMMTAALEVDVATLAHIVEQEEKGWQREQILEPARKALEGAIHIREQQAEMEAQEAQAKAPAKPKASNG